MFEKRQLGKTALRVPAIALGGNVFGWTVTEADSFRLLDIAYSLGLRFIDTADVYSKWVVGNRGGESETIIGKWLARTAHRSSVLLATKVGWELEGGRKGLSRGHIRHSIEESLRRLQTDYIDLYFSHIDDPRVPLEETLSTYEELIREGKIRFIGASNYGGERLSEAIKFSEENHIARYDVVQPLYNLIERQAYEHGLAPIVEQHGIGVTPYCALASGFLTGKYRSESDLRQRARAASVTKYLNPHGLRIVGALDLIARAYNVSPATVAVAWLIQRPTITSAIASATNETQLSMLAEAAQLRLAPPAIAQLTTISANGDDET